MIKRYTQFVKENAIEELSIENPMMDVRPETVGVEDEMNEDPVQMEEEEVEIDPYEKALMDLAEVAGVEYVEGKKSVSINGKEVTFPTETEKYHVQGVKKPFASAQEVVDYLNSDSRSKVSKEPSFEETEGDLAKRDLESEMSKFESKSYKSTRFRK